MSREQLLNQRWLGINNRGDDKCYEGIEVRITKEEFVRVFNNEDYFRLFSDWERAGKPRYLAPSIDRVDPRGHYEASNMRWLTLTDNVRRAKRGGHRGRAVMQLTRRGTLLAGFPSVASASKHTSISAPNIAGSALGHIPSAGGYLWEYAVTGRGSGAHITR